MSSVTFNVIISGVSVSGDLDVSKTPLQINLGNSDSIGMATFALQNANGQYSSMLFSGHALFQIDAMQGNNVIQTVFRGTLETASPVVDVISNDGSQVQFTGYDFAQELLGFVSPDARQPSTIVVSGDPGYVSGGSAISLISGDQGMGVLTGMDLALYVSGAIGSGTVGYPVGGYTLGKPLAASISAFMSQYFGKSGDTTGTNSGQAFSFKPYVSGISIWGSNPYYKAWYAPDYDLSGNDTNSNYWITYHTLVAKQEIAWDVLKKITRQGYAIDRSGTKTQFELYVGVSGDLHMRTSGATTFLASGISLIYYPAGTSGSQNNNVEQIQSLPWDSTNIKNFIVGWFPTWTTFPFGDDYTDIASFSGGYWSITNVQGGTGGTTALSGGPPAPGSPGMMSVVGTLSGVTAAVGSTTYDLFFRFWSGYTLDLTKWNVSGGAGVGISFQVQPNDNDPNASPQTLTLRIVDTSGNYIIISGQASNILLLDANQVANSGWSQVNQPIYTQSGTFYSGDGKTTGWAFGHVSGIPGAVASGIPDMTRINGIGIGFGMYGSINPSIFTLAVDQLQFNFVYNFNPLVAYNQASISGYGRRYEVFQFPYQYTDSGAQAVVTSELVGKMFSRQIGTFVVKDNPNLPFSAQFGITPGQAFVLDSPILAAGSGQFYGYWVTTSVKHEMDMTRGFITTIQAYPFFSGATVLSGQNIITYSLTKPMQVQPNVGAMMPNTTPWYMWHPVNA